MITDEAYISVTEIATLFKVVLNTDKLTSQHITQLLLDYDVISKYDKCKFKKDKLNGLNPSKYLPSNSVIKHCTRKRYQDISFYIWDFDYIVSLFNINFKTYISNESVSNFCTAIQKHISELLDVATVYMNLLKLQIILRQECILYN